MGITQAFADCEIFCCLSHEHPLTAGIDICESFNEDIYAVSLWTITGPTVRLSIVGEEKPHIFCLTHLTR